MNTMLMNAEEILSRHISGFHQYVLNDPAYLCYASENLCTMLQTNEKELVGDGKDGYLSFVHPADRE